MSTEPARPAIDHSNLRWETPRAEPIPQLVATGGTNLVAWGETDGTLTVLFQGGKLYGYRGASVAEHASGLAQAMAKGESCGKYFNSHMRRDARLTCAYQGRVVPDQSLAEVVREEHENGDGL